LVDALLARDFTAARTEAKRSGALELSGSLSTFTHQRLGLRNIGRNGVLTVDATFEARRLSEPNVVATW
jgi:hypothetical protein